MGFRSRLRNKISDVLKKKDVRTGPPVTSSNVSSPVANKKDEVSPPIERAPSPLTTDYSEKNNEISSETVESKTHPITKPKLKDTAIQAPPIETERTEVAPTLAELDTNEAQRFTVHTTETDEYVSNYMSSDAPVRLAHHADTAEETNNEFQIKVQNPDGSLLNFRGARNEFILDAADRAGLELPYSCRSGGCLSCAAKIISGVVHQSEQYVLEQEHLDDGFVLLCCCHASSDVEFIGYQEDNID